MNKIPNPNWSLILWRSDAKFNFKRCVQRQDEHITRLGSYVSYLEHSLVIVICGMIPLMIVGLALDGNPFNFRWTATAIISLLYLALAGSIAAFALNYWLLKRMDAMKIMLMSIVEPPLAVLLGVLVLEETLTLRAIWGTGCVLLGTALILPHTRKNESQRERTIDPGAKEDSTDRASRG